MVETKGLEASVNNWKNARGRVPAAYSEGIAAAKPWQEAAIKGEDLYANRLAETIASKKRARKIAEVSDVQWKQAATEKGAARIGPGMAAAEPEFRAGIGKVLDVIQGTTIGERTADVTANVTNRVIPIAVNLHEAFK